VEYMALVEAGNQASWYRMFLEELGYEIQDPILLYGDNHGTMKLVLNPVTRRRSKHIPIRYHAIRGYIKNQQLEVISMPTEDMLANGLTKPFEQIKLTNFVSGLGLT
jgi:hypothetical protein